MFIDLVYVAMFMSVGYILEYCGSAAEVMDLAFCLFAVMFISRLAIDEYSNRFFRDDIFHRLVYFVYTYGVFIMTLNINYTYSGHRLLADSSLDHNAVGLCPYVKTYWNGFAYGFFITRGSLVLLYTMVSYQNKDARMQFGLAIFRHTISILIVAANLNHEKRFYISYYPAIAVEVFFHVLPQILGIIKEMKVQHQLPIFLDNLTNSTYPMDIYEYQARLGIFYMMTLGESIIQLLSRAFTITYEEKVYHFVT